MVLQCSLMAKSNTEKGGPLHKKRGQRIHDHLQMADTFGWVHALNQCYTRTATLLPLHTSHAGVNMLTRLVFRGPVHLHAW